MDQAEQPARQTPAEGGDEQRSEEPETGKAHLPLHVVASPSAVSAQGPLAIAQFLRQLPRVLRIDVSPVGPFIVTRGPTDQPQHLFSGVVEHLTEVRWANQ